MSHDSKGPSHAACAETCAKAGVPLALLDEKTGAVYLPIASDQKNQNERLVNRHRSHQGRHDRNRDQDSHSNPGYLTMPLRTA